MRKRIQDVRQRETVVRDWTGRAQAKGKGKILKTGERTKIMEIRKKMR